MDTVQKHIYSNYHSPSSEPYRVYLYTLVELGCTRKQISALTFICQTIFYKHYATLQYYILILFKYLVVGQL
jgi:hypothetical protein